MANTILQLTRRQIRRAVLNLVNSLGQYDVIVANVTGGSPTTLVIPRLSALPPSATEKFIGANVYITEGAGSGQVVYVTDFDPITGTITVAPRFTAAFDTTSVVEIYSRWSKEQVEGAIDMAFWDAASRYLVPSEQISSAFESAFMSSRSSYPVSTARQLFRPEYPIPQRFLWLSQIDYDENSPVLYWPSANWTGDGIGLLSTDNPLNSNVTPAPRITIGQQFTVPASQWISTVSLYLYQPYGLSGYDYQIWIEDNADTFHIAVTNSQPIDGDDIPMSPTIMAFPLTRPVWLQPGKTYNLWLQPIDRTTRFPVVSSTSIPAGSPTVFWAIDNTGGFSTASGGGRPIYEKDVTSAPSQPFFDEAFSYLFYLYDRSSWKPFNHTHWSIVPSDNYVLSMPSQTLTDPQMVPIPAPQIHFDDGLVYAQDGTLFRLRGARGAVDFASSNPIVTDLSIPEVDPTFIIYKSASVLAMTRMPAPGMTPDQLQLQAQVWDAAGERHRQPFQIPPGALRRVR